MAIFSSLRTFFTKLKEHVPASSLYKVLIQAKQKERHEVFLALKNALDKEVIDTASFTAQLLAAKGSASQRKHTLYSKLQRELERVLARDPDKLEGPIAKVKLHLHELEKEKKSRHTFLVEVEGELLGKISENSLKELKRSLKAAFHLANDDLFEKEYPKLIQKIVDIIELLQRPFDSTGQLNTKILFTLRKALNNSGYQFLKELETHPAVHLLHSLCLASYADPVAMNAFKELGVSLAEVTTQEVSKEHKNKKLDFHDFLRSSHKHISKKGLIEKDLSFQYAQYFFPHLWISLFSLYLGRLLTFFGLKGYDPRGDIQNNPSALYDEELKLHERNAVVRTFYTPSVTIGDVVAPEAEAVLMALENRYFMTDLERKQDAYPYLMWTYTNLQNITSYNEGFRSRALMEMQSKYPFSFRAITLTQDSSFYRAQVKLSSLDDEPLSVSYREEMKKSLTHRDNFTLENRQKFAGGGYYFPKKIISKEILEKICDMAYSELIHEVKPKSVTQTRWNWMVKASFRELVTLGIIKYFQAKVAVELMEKFSDSCDIKLLATNTCKEGIDRGGKINACLLWALGQATEQEKQQVFAAFHSRALLSRYRMVISDRVEPMLSLTEVVTHDDLQKFLKDVCGKLLDVHSEKTHVLG
jgi:hypothetical protein